MLNTCVKKASREGSVSMMSSSSTQTVFPATTSSYQGTAVVHERLGACMADCTIDSMWTLWKELSLVCKPLRDKLLCVYQIDVHRSSERAQRSAFAEEGDDRTEERMLEEALLRAAREDAGKVVNRICLLSEQFSHMRYELFPTGAYVVGDEMRDGEVIRDSVCKVVKESAPSCDQSFCQVVDTVGTSVGVWWDWERWEHVTRLIREQASGGTVRREDIPFELASDAARFPSVYWEGDDGAELIRFSTLKEDDAGVCERKFERLSRLHWLRPALADPSASFPLPQRRVLSVLEDLLLVRMSMEDWLDCVRALHLACDEGDARSPVDLIFLCRHLIGRLKGLSSSAPPYALSFFEDTIRECESRLERISKAAAAPPSKVGGKKTPKPSAAAPNVLELTRRFVKKAIVEGKVYSHDQDRQVLVWMQAHQADDKVVKRYFEHVSAVEMKDRASISVSMDDLEPWVKEYSLERHQAETKRRRGHKRGRAKDEEDVFARCEDEKENGGDGQRASDQMGAAC